MHTHILQQRRKRFEAHKSPLDLEKVVTNLLIYYTLQFKAEGLWRLGPTACTKMLSEKHV